MNDLIEIGVKKFLEEEKTLTEIRLELKLKNTTLISKRLEEMGYYMYRGVKASSAKALKAAIEEYISEYNNEPCLTKIANKYKIDRQSLSNRLKTLGYEVINSSQKLRFDETIFDVIDTEEKAYWLGFIFADGYISSSPLDSNKK